MSDPDRAVDEVRRASDELGADGFALATKYDGAYPGDPRFEPVFAELDQRGASVFLHPINPYRPNSVLDASDLISSESEPSGKLLVVAGR